LLRKKKVSPDEMGVFRKGGERPGGRRKNRDDFWFLRDKAKKRRTLKKGTLSGITKRVGLRAEEKKRAKGRTKDSEGRSAKN